jgi:hypothetical protein
MYNRKKSSNNIRDHLVNTDLFNLYSMLNSVKVDLLWGRNQGLEDETSSTENKSNDQLRDQSYDANDTVVNNNNSNVTDLATKNVNESAPQATEVQQQQPQQQQPQQKGHVRRPSTVSVSSSNSSTSTISDSESEVSSNENDSGIESENQQNKDRSLEVAKQFRTHLLGLYKSLEQMTDAASYLTARYQSDMGGC